MKRSVTKNYRIYSVVIAAVFFLWLIDGCNQRKTHAPINSGYITIDYPLEGSIFPPELPQPTFLWRDTVDEVAWWKITIAFSDTSPAIEVSTPGDPLQLGASDPRCVSPTNKPPALNQQQATAHSWMPDSGTWNVIKTHSVKRPVTIVITGHQRGNNKKIVSSGQVSIQTSKDSVGAPIFYRDVPLMPSASEKGVIKPLSTEALPFIAWKLRNVAKKESRILLDGLHTCANCHSFSADGRTLGMDMDGPQNDKGLYAIVAIKSHIIIRKENLVKWSTFKGKLGSTLRVGFMSQISPDARYVITTINDPGINQSDYMRRRNPIDLARNYYVANFKDYRFLQVFYPTRGMLAWYSRETAHLQYLPGADDTGYVHTNAVWSPDGKYLVFARAKAQNAYPDNAEEAQYANDPNETQVQYDLFRIPFNDGKGGKPEPIIGASNNGMSNSFPKVSPDGQWIVFVQARNGLLMRPDGQLFIVPARGGTARRMKCNTPLMNSWHSFSPNGRWMVFSSKSRTPYTQMFLTHITPSGEDSPPILIDNATAANRAVNIPEFVTIPPESLLKIDAPAADYARYMDDAFDALKHQRYYDAEANYTKAIEVAPEEARAHLGLGVALVKMGKVDEAIERYRKAIALDPLHAEAQYNLGDALLQKDSIDAAGKQFEKAIQLNSEYVRAHTGLGIVLARKGYLHEAVIHLGKVVELDPSDVEAHRNFGSALLDEGKYREAGAQLEKALTMSSGNDPITMHFLGRAYARLGRPEDDIRLQNQAIAIAVQQNNRELTHLIRDYIKKH